MASGIRGKNHARRGRRWGVREEPSTFCSSKIVGPNADPEIDGRYIFKFISGLPIQWRGKVAERLYDRLSLALAHAQRIEVAERLHSGSLSACYAPVPPIMLGAATSLPTPQLLNVHPALSELRSEVEGLKHQMQDLSNMFQSLLELQKKAFKEKRQSRHSSSSSDSDREPSSQAHSRNDESGYSRHSGSRTLST